MTKINGELRELNVDGSCGQAGDYEAVMLRAPGEVEQVEAYIHLRATEQLIHIRTTNFSHVYF